MRSKTQQERDADDLRTARRELQGSSAGLTFPTIRHIKKVLQHQVRVPNSTASIELLEALYTRSGSRSKLPAPPQNQGCIAEVTICLMGYGQQWSVLIADKTKKTIQWYGPGVDDFLNESATAWNSGAWVR